MSTLVVADGGTVTVSAAALAQLVVHAAESVEGARVRRPRRRLEIAVSGGSARVELELAVRYGRRLAEAAREVQERVGAALATMCELRVEAVDVTVEELD